AVESRRTCICFSCPYTQSSARKRSSCPVQNPDRLTAGLPLRTSRGDNRLVAPLLPDAAPRTLFLPPSTCFPEFLGTPPVQAIDGVGPDVPPPPRPAGRQAAPPPHPIGRANGRVAEQRGIEMEVAPGGEFHSTFELLIKQRIRGVAGSVFSLASTALLGMYEQEPTPKTGLQKAGYNCCAQLSAGHFKLRKYYNYGYGSRRSWSDRQTPKGVIWVHGLLDETPTGDDVLLWSCWVTTYA
ncbi:hypothetical protein Taro_049385, partial [Colocasia esculenta]|nr:hypothetical protein [Colocasia esculenta]